jgi:hypothetical protein
MSNTALNWAFAVPVKRSTDKFVLVALANRADAEGECFPSHSTLEAATSLDRKTILGALKRLCGAGLLKDTGARKGHTARTIVYRLEMEVAQTEVETPEPQRHHNGPVNGTITENQIVPNFPPNSPVFPTKWSQISHLIVPNTGHRTLLEPSLNPKGTHNTPIPPSPPAGRNGGKGHPLNGHAKAFETWWQAYPRKVAKGTAAKAYAKALTLTDADTLLGALDREWGTRKYIPHPTTWLNAQRWLDEIETGDPVLRAVGLDPHGDIFPPPDLPATPVLRIVR